MKIISICIVALFVLRPVAPVAEYFIDYDYIKNELCENKTAPELHCNGKCHLVKELAKASENEKPISNDKKSTQEKIEILYFQNISDIEWAAFSSAVPQLNFDYLNLYQNNFANSVFHPPAV